MPQTSLLLNSVSAHLPLLIYGVCTVVLVLFIIGLSYYLGGRHKEKSTDEPYESGIKTTGNARLRFSSQFYLIAMFFVIFDLEAAFLIAWAISVEEVGWMGFAGAVFFIVVLMAVLIYEWKIGALDFGPNGRKIVKAYRKKFGTELKKEKS